MQSNIGKIVLIGALAGTLLDVGCGKQSSQSMFYADEKGVYAVCKTFPKENPNYFGLCYVIDRGDDTLYGPLHSVMRFQIIKADSRMAQEIRDDFEKQKVKVK